MTALERLRTWPWLTLQIIAANVAIIMALAAAWYLVFMQQSDVYSARLMSTFNIEPGRLHTMYVEDVERQLWTSVIVGLVAAIILSGQPASVDTESRVQGTDLPAAVNAPLLRRDI